MGKAKDYKAIGFDYGGVIGGVGTVGTNFTKQICQILDIDEKTYKNVYFGMNYKIHTGAIEGWHEFWKVFVNKIGKPENYNAVITLSDKANEDLQVVDTKMLGLVDELRSKGYKTGLLSNTNAENGRKMRAIGVDEHFDAFHISAETKLMKPNPKAFIHLAEALGVPLDEIAFVDDSQNSLRTASEIGFTPILFKNYKKLRVQLSELGIL